MKILEYYDYNPGKLIAELSIRQDFKVVHFTAQQIFEIGVLRIVEEINELKPDLLIYEMDSAALHQFMADTFHESEIVSVIDNFNNRSADKERIVKNITSVYEGNVIVTRDPDDLSLIYTLNQGEIKLMNTWHKVNPSELNDEEPRGMAICVITGKAITNAMTYYYNGVTAISEEAALALSKEVINQ